MLPRRRAQASFRVVGIAVCALAAVSCSRSREPSDGGAAHGGDTAGKGGKGGGGAGAGAVGGEGGAGSDGGKGGGPVAGKGGSGGAPAPGTLVPADGGGFCCIPDEKPGCCMVYGGFQEKKGSGCGGVCDGMPMPDEAWTLATDEHGCKHWVEPLEWEECCGCEPAPRHCDPNGAWKIEFEDAGPCGLSSQTITISSADDAGTAQVTFENLGSHGWNCGGTPNRTYEATVSASPNGCVVTVGSHEKWCSGNEPQCEDLDLKLYRTAWGTAEVEGTYRRCWCQSSGPEGTTVKLRGEAEPVE